MQGSLALFLVAASLLVVPTSSQGVDKATATAVGGFSSAHVVAGGTVASVACSPLKKSQTVTLYDIATGQALQSTCDVTTRIEEFVKGAPEEALAILDTVKAEANNTAAFSVYLAKTLDSIAANVAANVKNLTQTEQPIDLKGPFDRLAQFIHENKADPLSCAASTLYPGAHIPTQCVGPVYQLVIAGGTCTEDPSSGVVTCTAPSVELTKTPGACNLMYTSPDVIQDSYCASSTSYGNSTQDTFAHPAEVFNLEKLFSVPNPFNLDLSLFTATASASASPGKKDPRPFPTGYGLGGLLDPGASAGFPFDPRSPGQAPGQGPAPAPDQASQRSSTQWPLLVAPDSAVAAEGAPAVPDLASKGSPPPQVQKNSAQLLFPTAAAPSAVMGGLTTAWPEESLTAPLPNLAPSASADAEANVAEKGSRLGEGDHLKASNPNPRWNLVDAAQSASAPDMAASAPALLNLALAPVAAPELAAEVVVSRQRLQLPLPQPAPGPLAGFKLEGPMVAGLALALGDKHELLPPSAAPDPSMAPAQAPQAADAPAASPAAPELAPQPMLASAAAPSPAALPPLSPGAPASRPAQAQSAALAAPADTPAVPLPAPAPEMKPPMFAVSGAPAPSLVAPFAPEAHLLPQPSPLMPQEVVLVLASAPSEAPSQAPVPALAMHSEDDIALALEESMALYLSEAEAPVAVAPSAAASAASSLDQARVTAAEMAPALSTAPAPLLAQTAAPAPAPASTAQLAAESVPPVLLVPAQSPLSMAEHMPALAAPTAPPTQARTLAPQPVPTAAPEEAGQGVPAPLALSLQTSMEVYLAQITASNTPLAPVEGPIAEASAMEAPLAAQQRLAAPAADGASPGFTDAAAANAPTMSLSSQAAAPQQPNAAAFALHEKAAAALPPGQVAAPAPGPAPAVLSVDYDQAPTDAPQLGAAAALAPGADLALAAVEAPTPAPLMAQYASVTGAPALPAQSPAAAPEEIRTAASLSLDVNQAAPPQQPQAAAPAVAPSPKGLAPAPSAIQPIQAPTGATEAPATDKQPAASPGHVPAAAGGASSAAGPESAAAATLPHAPAAAEEEAFEHSLANSIELYLRNAANPTSAPAPEQGPAPAPASSTLVPDQQAPAAAAPQLSGVAATPSTLALAAAAAQAAPAAAPAATQPAALAPPPGLLSAEAPEHAYASGPASDAAGSDLTLHQGMVEAPSLAPAQAAPPTSSPSYTPAWPPWQLAALAPGAMLAQTPSTDDDVALRPAGATAAPALSPSLQSAVSAGLTAAQAAAVAPMAQPVPHSAPGRPAQAAAPDQLLAPSLLPVLVKPGAPLPAVAVTAAHGAPGSGLGAAQSPALNPAAVQTPALLRRDRTEATAPDGSPGESTGSVSLGPSQAQRSPTGESPSQQRPDIQLSGTAQLPSLGQLLQGVGSAVSRRRSSG